MAEVFGLQISEGALCNILARARAPLLAATQPITEAVRQAPVVCCDETSARVGGNTPAFAGAGSGGSGPSSPNQPCCT